MRRAHRRANDAMMSTMNENGTHDRSEPGVLGSLPRTRPQRPSRRRESTKTSSKPQTASPARAAKTSAKPRTAKAPHTAKAAATKSSAAKTSSAKAPPPRRREPPAPKQGYEPMEDPKTGATVHPPSGTELVESIATIVAELASVGVKAGGRVLKDALWPIRRT
jgi:hypothetical protein